MSLFSESMHQIDPHRSKTRNHLIRDIVWVFPLVAAIGLGLFFRFNWTNWDQNTDLHPDEYGLTGTLTRLSIPRTWATTSTRASRPSARMRATSSATRSATGPTT